MRHHDDDEINLLDLIIWRKILSTDFGKILAKTSLQAIAFAVLTPIAIGIEVITIAYASIMGVAHMVGAGFNELSDQVSSPKTAVNECRHNVQPVKGVWGKYRYELLFPINECNASKVIVNCLREADPPIVESSATSNGRAYFVTPQYSSCEVSLKVGDTITTQWKQAGEITGEVVIETPVADKFTRIVDDPVVDMQCNKDVKEVNITDTRENVDLFGIFGRQIYEINSWERCSQNKIIMACWREKNSDYPPESMKTEEGFLIPVPHKFGCEVRSIELTKK
jgi:hypothetical protein